MATRQESDQPWGQQMLCRYSFLLDQGLMDSILTQTYQVFSDVQMPFAGIIIRIRTICVTAEVKGKDLSGPFVLLPNHFRYFTSFKRHSEKIPRSIQKSAVKHTIVFKGNEVSIW